MAVRQITPVEKVVKCHVNSVDGSPVYESGVPYEAGTLVIYNGMPYVSVVPIEDNDTDTPDAAPVKWSITPDAFTASASESGLANRVSTLEDEMNTAQTDISFLKGHSLVQLQDINVPITSGTTLIGAMTSVMDALIDAAVLLEDDEIIVPQLLNVPLDASGNLIALHVTGQYVSNTSNYTSRLDICEGRISYTNVKLDLYVARAGAHDQTNKTFQHFVINNGSVSAEDLSAITLTSNCTGMVRIFKYKKIT